METHNIMSFKAMLLLLLFASVLAKADLDPSTILKTIVSGDETIDCVDIYKQPAFNHPLLKNYTLHLKPSSYPVGSNSRISARLTQKWHESGEFCTEGTVPILRKPAKNTTSNETPNSNPVYVFQNYAEATLIAPRGGQADLNVWAPHVGTGEVSVALVRVNIARNEWVEAGWRVGPGGSGYEPVLYTYWTYRGELEGCNNLECPGFVQVTSKLSIGAKITPISQIDGRQYQFNIKIFKEEKTGDWCLMSGETVIGFWPKHLFSSPLEAGALIEWGGKATKKYAHTVVEMGSGYFADQGLRKAAFVSHLEYADEDLRWIKAPVDQVRTNASRPNCYTVMLPEYQKEFGTHFFYGGDGGGCVYSSNLEI